MLVPPAWWALATVGLWVTIWVARNTIQAANRLVETQDTAWLVDVLRGHVGTNDAVLWVGVATKEGPGAKKDARGVVVFGCFLSLAFVVPSFVWLCIGLPYELQTDWEFGFYYPA